MKIIRGFKVRGFILAAAFSAGLGFGTSASAQAEHSYLVDLNSKTVIDIGTLGGANSLCLWHQRRRAGGRLFRHGWRHLHMLSSPAPMGRA